MGFVLTIAGIISIVIYGSFLYSELLSGDDDRYYKDEYLVDESIGHNLTTKELAFRTYFRIYPFDKDKI